MGSAFDAAKQGGTLSSTLQVSKVAAHGVVGGLSAQASGGTFESGFWSAGLSQAAGQYGVYDKLGAVENAKGWDIAYNASVAAVVGGSVSELTGGSFDQGALNAAMGRLFNDVAHAGMIGTLPASVALGEALSTLGGYAVAGTEVLAAAIGAAATPLILIGVAIWPSEIGPEAHSSTPVGHEGYPLEVTPGTNSPTNIEGRQYTGHAIDRMQGRGIPPSVVEDTIVSGSASSGKRPGTNEYRSKENRVRVITNTNGDVITVIPR